MRDKARVFLIDDDELIALMLSKSLKNEGYEVHAETNTFNNIVSKIKSWSPDVVLLDIRLPEQSGIDILKEIRSSELNTQVVMLTSDDTAETAVKCMKLGAVDYLTKPFNMDEVKIVISNIIEKERLKQEINYLRRVYCELFEKDIIGESGVITELKANMEKIAHARVPSILITGESGTGKELVARCIHRIMNEWCASRCAPFIAINCTALPETLLESELFGYEKGAFTDAKTEKKGIFELANGGTILLDEIGDMKPNLQSKLLRVLEERTIRRIGGHEEIPIDVTVMATSNRDLSDEVEKGEFRIDLFYRLNTFSLHILPLRDRREDIPILAKYFLVHFTTKYDNKTLKGISPTAEKLLVSYNWPGNVRELRNVIERIVVLENSEFILPEHLPKEIISPSHLSNHRFILPDTGLSLDKLEKELIQQALEKAKNNKSLAAKLLNISYDSLRYQIKKFGLE
ncbi:MAG: sigma-54 dependent transcriptional regulator [Nitrospirota bacterium]